MATSLKSLNAAGEWLFNNLGEIYERYNLSGIVLAEAIISDKSNWGLWLLSLDNFDEKKKDKLLAEVIASLLHLLESSTPNASSGMKTIVSVAGLIDALELISDPNSRKRLNFDICTKYYKPDYLLENIDKSKELWANLDDRNSLKSIEVH